MTSPVDLVIQSVNVRGPRYIPAPADGEPLADYAMRCMEIGALLAVEPVSTINLANAARVANQAQDTLRSLPASTVETGNNTTTEGTPE